VEFWVGVNERHYVAFTYDKFMGTTKIFVDGQQMVDHLEVFSASLTKNWDFYTGFQERHLVRIVKTRKAFFAGFRPQLVQAYVDGQFIGQYEA